MKERRFSLKNRVLLGFGALGFLAASCVPATPNAADNLFIKCQVDSTKPAVESYVLTTGQRIAISGDYLKVVEPGRIVIDNDDLELDGARYVVTGIGAFSRQKYLVTAERQGDKLTAVSVSLNCPDPSVVAR